MNKSLKLQGKHWLGKKESFYWHLSFHYLTMERWLRGTESSSEVLFGRRSSLFPMFETFQRQSHLVFSWFLAQICFLFPVKISWRKLAIRHFFPPSERIVACKPGNSARLEIQTEGKTLSCTARIYNQDWELKVAFFRTRAFPSARFVGRAWDASIPRVRILLKN